MNELFISHASKDKPLVDRFIDLVLDTGCGLSRNEISYTSDPDMGIQPGKDFIDYIKRHIEEATIVILIVSPNFYNSEFCLGELGATWALEIEILPLIVPDLDIDNVGNLLQVTQMGMINNKSYLDRLRDIVVRTHNIPTPKTATWNLKCDQFLRELPGILKTLPTPSKVEKETFQELEETYQAVLEEIQVKQHEIDDRDRIIEQLKKTKNKVDVRNILLKNSSEKDQFELLINEAKTALKNLPPITLKVFYFDHIDELFRPENNKWKGVSDYDDAIEAQRDGYLSEHHFHDNAFVPNDNDQNIKIAREGILRLSDFLMEIESESTFGQYFYDENGFDVHDCMSNRRFWTNYLS